jgi:hypothetical protein
MLDSPAERALVYRLAAAYDCWGQRRAVRHGVRNGIWFLDPTALDEPAGKSDDAPVCNREERLAQFEASGCFTRTELSTLRALVVERLTIDEIAARDGCSRQAVLARLAGNSRGQGGILKKAQALLSAATLSDESVERPRRRTRTRQPLRRPRGRRHRAA